MPGIRMVHLLTVSSGFQARVLSARLGSEGIVTELRGAVDGPYPFGDVLVYVEAGDLELASQLLLADEVEEAFTRPHARNRRRTLAVGVPAWLAVAAVIFVAIATSIARVLTL